MARKWLRLSLVVAASANDAYATSAVPTYILTEHKLITINIEFSPSGNCMTNAPIAKALPFGKMHVLPERDTREQRAPRRNGTVARRKLSEHRLLSANGFPVPLLFKPT